MVAFGVVAYQGTSRVQDILVSLAWAITGSFLLSTLLHMNGRRYAHLRQFVWDGVRRIRSVYGQCTSVFGRIQANKVTEVRMHRTCS